MGFLGVLKTIGRDLIHVGTVAEPFVMTLNPFAGTLLSLALDSITRAEQIHSEDGQGVTKKKLVMDELLALLPQIETGIGSVESRSKELQKCAPTIDKLIDDLVSVLNGVNKVSQGQK